MSALKVKPVNGTIGVQALRGFMATTKMIAGLMGPTLLAIGIAMLVNARHFPEMAKQIGNDPGLIFVSGTLLLVAGLAIVRVHNVWSGGWRVVVTVLGWLAVISGILRMLLPFWAASIASSLGQSSTPVIIGALVPLLVGAFLSYKAFTID
jgi:uncharacterized membrane protein HdeD (DUF308 family)